MILQVQVQLNSSLVRTCSPAAKVKIKIHSSAYSTGSILCCLQKSAAKNADDTQHRKMVMQNLISSSLRKSAAGVVFLAY